MILNMGTPKKVSLIVGNPDVLFISGTPHRSCPRDTAQLQLQVSHEVPREVQASRSSLSLRIHMRYRGYMGVVGYSGDPRLYRGYRLYMLAT